MLQHLANDLLRHLFQMLVRNNHHGLRREVVQHMCHLRRVHSVQHVGKLLIPTLLFCVLLHCKSVQIVEAVLGLVRILPAPKALVHAPTQLCIPAAKGALALLQLANLLLHYRAK